jgi:YD repeat-containing protein
MAAFFRNCAPNRLVHSTLIVATALGLASNAPAAFAQQTRSLYQEQGELVRGSRVIGSLGTDLFGDKVSLYTGSLEFVQTDVSLPGNSALPVSVGRRLIAGGRPPGNGHFGKWDLEIPHLHGVFSSGGNGGWSSYSGAAPQQRCSNFGKPAPAWDMNNSSTWNGDEFWNGTFLYVPGMGDQEVLRRTSANALAPTDGQSYPLVTRNHWQFRCLTGLANDASVDKARGQGFVALSPDGTVYQFDQMVSRPTSYLEKPVPRPLGTESTAPIRQTESLMAGVPPPSEDQYFDLRMRRAEYWMLPTRVTDRFGNTVTYVYDASDPWKLMSITANDEAGTPRSLSFTYVTGSHQIATASDGSRTWSYNYSGTGAFAVLNTVTLPDGSAWQLTGADALMVDFTYASEGSAACDSGGNLAVQDLSGSITHPSGATGTFTLRPVMHARSGVPRECLIEGSSERSRYPNFFANHALISKTISGPGLAPMTWSSAYSDPVMSWAPCVGCVATSTTELTEPSGARARYTFGTLFQRTEGQLQQVDVIEPSGTVLRSTVTQYQDPASA